MAPYHRNNSKHIQYVGRRPKDDQDNLCREKLCHLVQDVGCFHEICAEKLYLINLAEEKDTESFLNNINDPNCPFIFWGFHDTPSLTYESFNMDFGPFNLAVTHQFISKLKIWLDTQPYRDPDKYVAVVLDDSDLERKLNTTLLVAVAAMVLLGMSEDDVFQKLDFFMMYKGKPGERTKQLVFREKKKFSDVSGIPSIMSLTLADCIKAFGAALRSKFYNYYEFDPIEYVFYEAVVSGDLNWIIPGKILAFAGPSDNPVQSKIYHKHPPKFYHQYFRDHNVTTIIRLNEPEYESSGFSDVGFKHYDLIFPDGFSPTSAIANKFIKIVDESPGAVAVHCYAGLGRTGTLIAAYIRARYDFTAQMAIAWTRVCRPGSVIGDQQDWLSVRFDPYSSKYCKAKQVVAKVKPTLESVDNNQAPLDGSQKLTYEIVMERYGQARALLMAKKQRAHSDRPRTRRSNFKRDSSDAGDSTKDIVTKKLDVVLDLGKSIPLMLDPSDIAPLKNGEKPKFYHVKDNKYEWKVKFPEPGYVALRPVLKIDTITGANVIMMGDSKEPILVIKHEPEEPSHDSKAQLEESSKLKPVAYYHFASWSKQ